jgi:hypothetical protein
MATNGLSELSRAARESRVLSDLIQVADWVGDGRTVTAAGKPHPDDLPELAAALGIELTSRRKRRDARDASDLLAVWQRAEALEFVESTDGQARQGPTYRALLAPENDELTLEVWRGCFAFLAAPEAPEALTDLDPAALTATLILHILTGHEGSTSLVRLTADVQAVLAAQFDDQPGIPGMPPGQPKRLVSDAVRLLDDLGAVRSSGKSVELAPLGEWLAEELAGEPVEMIDPAAEPAAVLQQIVEHELPDAMEMTLEWVEARDPEVAAQALLTAAATAGPMERQGAFLLIQEHGLESERVMRWAADLPAVGPYARTHLFEIGHGKPPDQADLEWITVDLCAAALLHVSDPDELATGTPDLYEAVRWMRPDQIDALEHPHGDLVKSILPSTRSGTKRRTRAAVGTAGKSGGTAGGYQLKIQLRNVSKPPVWRRIVVPADVRLDELSEVILGAMGWHGSHLHVLEDRSTGLEYGPPDSDLGHRDEGQAKLSDLVRDVGDTFLYTYDFGDGWEHLITIEQRAENDFTPGCLAGKGACPPEDCGGAYGYAELKEILAEPTDERHQEMLEWLGLDDPSDFDPTAFDPDDATQQVRMALSG